MNKHEVTAIYHRVLNHEAFAGLNRKPRLVVTKFSRPRNKHGHARYMPAEVKINIWNGLDKYSVEETVIHELAHHMAFQLGERGHGAVFHREMDKAFKAIHPEAVRFLAPRRNRYHGRYSAAMRSAAVVTEAPQVQQDVQDLLNDSAALREAVERLLAREPQLAAVAVVIEEPEAPKEAKPEPYQNILDRVFFGGPAEPRQPRTARRTTTRREAPVPTGEPTRGPVARGYFVRNARDRRVYEWFADRSYEGRPKDAALALDISEGQVRHALWRLRNDGRVENHRRGFWRTIA